MDRPVIFLDHIERLRTAQGGACDGDRSEAVVEKQDLLSMGKLSWRTDGRGSL